MRFSFALKKEKKILLLLKLKREGWPGLAGNFFDCMI